MRKCGIGVVLCCLQCGGSKGESGAGPGTEGSSGGGSGGSPEIATGGVPASGGGAQATGGMSEVVDCTGDFTNPRTILQGERRTSPALTGDQLELFFVQGEPGEERIRVVSRSSRDGMFGAAVDAPGLDEVCGVLDRSLDVSYDGLRAYVSCVSDFEEVAVLYLLMRPDRTSAFSNPQEVGMFPSSPALSADELTIYGSLLSADRGTTSATRTSPTAPFGEREPVSGLEADFLFAPGISPDGLELYGGAGAERVLSRATRPSTLLPFSAPVALPDLAEGYDAAGAPELSQDCRTMVYASALSMPDGYEWYLLQVER